MRSTSRTAADHAAMARAMCLTRAATDRIVPGPAFHVLRFLMNASVVQIAIHAMKELPTMADAPLASG
eukprot:6486433-Amphidinium_carterae.1